MFFPVSTDSPVRRTPWVNYGLIAFNGLILLATHGAGPGHWSIPLHLNTGEPALYQFFSYQFLHADLGHLAGNMLFLWVFGNSVNGTFGHIPYLLFYLAGGLMAGLGFAVENSGPDTAVSLVGASGAVAAVTAAYVAIFPRCHVRLIYWFFFIGFIDIRALLVVVFKIVLWDNIIAPRLGSAGSVAYSAHLAGYAFGFAGTMGLLLIRALPRDQFDAVALFKRWWQRQSFAGTMRDPTARATAQHGRVARPISMNDVDSADKESENSEEVTALRTAIASCVTAGDLPGAAERYQELIALDEKQVLPRQQQLDVCHRLYTDGRSLQAAAGYERFLRTYANAAEALDVRLLLGIIYARDLEQYEAAERHLTDVKDRLTGDRRIAQHREWLSVVLTQLGRPSTEA